MAAGVSAVPHSQMAGHHIKLMPSQKVGTEFLASSHFKIAQDDAVFKGTLKSIFKKDYVPWDVNSKPPGANPPHPADILQKDDRYFNEKASETKHAYEYRQLPTQELKDPHKNLSATNFKMDSDPRLNSFQTSHNRDYTPKSVGRPTRCLPNGNPMQSYIPQGDPDKAPEPISDYRDRYRGHDALTTKPDKAGSLYLGGPKTIQGDLRQHHFNTTHNDAFKGHKLPKLASYPAPLGNNIPQGDVDKEIAMVTTHQSSYPKHLQAGYGYDKNAVMGKLQETNFKQGAGHGAWNNYLSTMTDSYRPQDGPVERHLPTQSRNHSDFPTGDDNALSNANRANMTTNRFYQGNLPTTTTRPKVESGADKRTKSNVWFGEPHLDKDYYETTTDSTFKPVSVPYKFMRPDLNTRSAVPLDYYDNDKNNTTYKADFYNPESGKMITNPDAIEKLKESHIRAPLGGERWFSTEHLEQYTPKRTVVRRTDDPGRLQRSSVPIGTLNA